MPSCTANSGKTTGPQNNQPAEKRADTPLDSSGTVLIAARKAYFEYKNLDTQARLFDSIGSESVSFGRISLHRWTECQFSEYAHLRGVENADEIYEDISTRLSTNHPLLTRAVLVRRLLDVAVDSETRSSLISDIENNPKGFFRQFVGSIISREANQKWIDKVGELAQPLISEDDHYALLSNIALEMWSNKTEALRSEVLDLVSELFSESKRNDKVVTHQIVERVKQHALLVGAGKGQFAFDHQEFYHFFLGEAIGRLLVSSDGPGIRHAFKQGMLPLLTNDIAARYTLSHHVTPFDPCPTGSETSGRRMPNNAC